LFSSQQQIHNLERGFIKGTEKKSPGEVHGQSRSSMKLVGQSPPAAGNFLQIILQLECGPMPNVMAALPNTGGALNSMPQSLADAHY